MILETLVVGDLDTNCYIVADENTKEAAVIDPGGNAGSILETIARKGYKVSYVLLTHGHWDHFSAAKEVAESAGAKIAIHKVDSEALLKPSLSLAYLFGEQGSEDMVSDFELTDGQVINIGDVEAHIAYTPGHTPGSVSIYIEDSIFAGDLLFYRSIGRTDFPGGSLEMLLASVRDKIFVHPDDVKIYPGHGPATTVGDERRNNPFLMNR